MGYAECHKPQRFFDGKLDGCQEYLRVMGTVSCGNCGCERHYHRKLEPVIRHKTEVVYTKCHKIHDFKFQTTVDGCQEFSPKGKDGTAEALTCALCGCHKGFHRNEITIEVTSD